MITALSQNCMLCCFTLKIEKWVWVMLTNQTLQKHLNVINQIIFKLLTNTIRNTKTQSPPGKMM